MLEIKEAKTDQLSTLQDFFGDRLTEVGDVEDLHQYGRFVELSNVKKGFFALFPLENGEVWLRSLYLHDQTNPGFILTLLEVIKSYVEAEEIRKVYVFSHQLTIDPLLSAHQFQNVAEEGLPPTLKKVDRTGTWWAYENRR